MNSICEILYENISLRLKSHHDDVIAVLVDVAVAISRIEREFSRCLRTIYKISQRCNKIFLKTTLHNKNWILYVTFTLRGVVCRFEYPSNLKFPTATMTLMWIVKLWNLNLTSFFTEMWEHNERLRTVFEWRRKNENETKREMKITLIKYQSVVMSDDIEVESERAWDTQNLKVCRVSTTSKLLKAFSTKKKHFLSIFISLTNRHYDIIILDDLALLFCALLTCYSLFDDNDIAPKWCWWNL